MPSLSRRIAPQEVANPLGTDNLLLFGGAGKLRRAALGHQFRQDLDHVGRGPKTEIAGLQRSAMSGTSRLLLGWPNSGHLRFESWRRRRWRATGFEQSG